MGRSSGTRYEDVDEERYAFAPQFVWEPTDQTRLAFGGYYQSDPEGGFFNSVFPADQAPAFSKQLDHDLNPGDPNFDEFDRKQYGAYATLDHAFSSNLISRTKLRYSSLNLDFQGIQLVGTPPSETGLIARRAVQTPETVRSFAFDTSLEYGFETGTVAHTLLAGIETNWNESEAVFRLGAAPDLDLTNPTYPGVAGPFATFFDNRQTTRQSAIYLSDRLEFGNFHASLGVRHDWVETETENHLTSTVSDQSSEATTYQAALLYRFDNGAAPYISYSTSFEPLVGVDANGNSFVPMEAKQFEVGLKYELPNNELLLTAAAFDITQENVRTPDAANPFLSVQTGEIRSRGIELEGRGQITENLNFIAALTLLDTEVTKTNVAAALGNRPQAVPDYFGSIWLNYAFSGALQGATVGGGIRFVGDSFGDDANTVVRTATPWWTWPFAMIWANEIFSLTGWRQRSMFETCSMQNILRAAASTHSANTANLGRLRPGCVTNGKAPRFHVRGWGHVGGPGSGQFPSQKNHRCSGEYDRDIRNPQTNITTGCDRLFFCVRPYT